MEAIGIVLTVLFLALGLIGWQRWQVMSETLVLLKAKQNTHDREIIRLSKRMTANEKTMDTLYNGTRFAQGFEKGVLERLAKIELQMAENSKTGGIDERYATKDGKFLSNRKRPAGRSED